MTAALACEFAFIVSRPTVLSARPTAQIIQFPKREQRIEGDPNVGRPEAP